MREIWKESGPDRLEPLIGTALMSKAGNTRHLCEPLENGACFLTFRFFDVAAPEKREERVSAYCDREKLVLVTESGRCIAAMESAGESLPPMEQLVRFFSALIAPDFDSLERMEDAVTSLENDIVTANKPLKSVGRRIVTMRRGLLSTKRYYEQLSLVTSDLSEDLEDVVPDAYGKRFAALDRRVDRLLGSVLHLREYVTQVREAYQAQIDIEQNQIMKVFTVVTAVFLPLTLIVGWYGMNLQMPEYRWQMGYPFVIGLSVAVCALCFLFFKKKNWF